MREDDSFTLGAYVGDQSAFIALTAALVGFVTAVLGVMRVTISGIVLVDLAIALCAAVHLTREYLRRRRFWRELEEAAESADKAEHLPDLVQEPRFLEGRIAYDAIRAAASLAGAETAELREAARANADYIDTWVHEVKTPIAAARLIADKNTGEDANALRRELERTEALVQQALYASRVDGLSSDYLIREVGLAGVVRETCKSNMHYLTSLGVSVEVNVAPGLTVLADKSWLGFVLTQLVVNSAKYGARTITVTATEPESESSHACTTLEVRDDGCGIPATDVPRVFERGFTGEVGRSHGSATGMGLYLAAEMCRRMGIGILLASEENVGTRVKLSFPHDRRRENLTGL